MISRFLAARVIFSMESSTCSNVWVAISEYLIKLSFLGTAGETTGLTKMPSSSRSLVICRALMLSLIYSGMMGVSDLPVSKPADLNPSRAKLASFQRCSMRSGSFDHYIGLRQARQQLTPVSCWR